MVLKVEKIDAFYGQSQILHAVSMAMEEGSRVAVVGRNGAGKSTLLKSIMNAGPTVKGKVIWQDKEFGSTPPFKRVRQGLALVPEDRRIYRHITVRENIVMATHGVRSGEKPIEADALIDRFPMLQPIRNRPGGQLSGGQQQMVAIARAIAARPRLMMLDEPTEGLAPVIVEQLAKDISGICSEHGAGLLLCEQNLWFARQCTDRLYVIDSGQIVFEGDWNALDGKPEIKSRYLAV